jgi:CHRD domain
MNNDYLNVIRTGLLSTLAVTLIGTAGCSRTTPPPSKPVEPATSSTPTVPAGVNEPKAANLSPVSVTSTLGGLNEVPSVSGSGSGNFDAKLDQSTNTLTWTVGYSGLSGPVTAAHIHGPAMSGENAPPVVPIEGSLVSPIAGVNTLTAAQVNDLKAGRLYFNIHTAANPNGEIRGQLGLKP